MPKALPLLISALLVCCVWLSKPSRLRWPQNEDGTWFRPESGLMVWAGYGWWSLVAAALLAGVLLWTRSWWLRPTPAAAGKSQARPWSRAARGALILVLLLSAGLRLPVLQHPVQRDEQDNLINQIHGSWHLPAVRSPVFRGALDNLDTSPENLQRILAAVDLPGTGARWKQAGWMDTLFLNWIGNNSAPNSLLARVSNETWQSLTAADPHRFQLVAVRLPAFLFVTAAVGLFFGLVHRWLGWQQALLAASLLALHPLMIQFGVLSRGYGFLLFSMMLAIHFYERASAPDGSWRQAFWAALALAAGFYAYPGFLIPGLLICLLFTAVAWRGSTGQGAARMRPWLAAHLLALACWLPVGLPMLIQSGFAVTHNFPHHSDSPWWFSRFWSEGIAGMEIPTSKLLPFSAKAAELPADLALRIFQATPAAVILLILLSATLLLGGRRLWKISLPAALSVTALVSGALLTALSNYFGSGRELLPWYGVYLAPVLPLTLAALWQTGAGGLQKACILTLAVSVPIVSFPDHRPGRLAYYPPSQFERISWNHFGARIVSDRSGRSVTY
jgi:hypothetical protein